MRSLPIILAAILGAVISVPVHSPGFKERIFKNAVTPYDKEAQLKELLMMSGASTRNSLIEDLLNNAINSLRDLILNGSDTVPVLDPFNLDELHLSGDLVDIPNSYISLKNVAVANLGTFEIDKLRVTTVSLLLQRYRIELIGRIPVLDVEVGNYDLSLSVFGADIFGNGDTKIKILNPTIDVNLEVGLRLAINGIFLTVRELKMQFTLDAFEAQITGLFGDPVASDFVSSFLSSLVPELLEHFEEDITNILSSTVLEVANNILNDLNIMDLLP